MPGSLADDIAHAIDRYEAETGKSARELRSLLDEVTTEAKAPDRGSCSCGCGAPLPPAGRCECGKPLGHH